MVADVFAPVPLAGRVAAAVAIHVGAQVARGLAWHGVLTASWPRTSRTRACGWYVCGAGLSGLISAPGGDAVRLSLAKRELPAASWPALGGTLVAEKPFEIACSVLLTVVALSLG